MSNLFVNLPAPAGNGVGGAVDMSGFGGLKVIEFGGAWVAPLKAPVINIEMNNDAGQAGSWAPVCTFYGKDGPGQVKQLNIAAKWFRMRVSGFTGGTTPRVDVGGGDDGTSFASLPVTAADGVGAPVDISTLPELKTLQIGAPFTGSCILEISEDAGGVDWAQIVALQAPGQHTFVNVAYWARLRRKGTKSQAPGLPIVNLGATFEGGGGSSNPLSNIPALPQPLSPAGFAALAWDPATSRLVVSINGAAYVDINTPGVPVQTESVTAFPGASVAINAATAINMSAGNGTFAINDTGVHAETQLSQPINLIADANGAINLIAGGDMSLVSSNGEIDIDANTDFNLTADGDINATTPTGDVTLTATAGLAGCVAGTQAYLFGPIASLSNGNAQLDLTGNNVTASAGPTGAVTSQSPLGGSVVVNAAVHVTPFPSVP